MFNLVFRTSPVGRIFTCVPELGRRASVTAYVRAGQYVARR